MRRRCSCPCPTHPPKPGAIQVDAVLVPPLADGALAGYVIRRQLADGSRQVYFEPYADGKIGRPEPLPDVVPASWTPAVEWAKRFLAGTAVTR